MPVNNAPFAYFGGKWRILDELQAYLPPAPTLDCYVEPFFGSGTLYFSRARLAEVEVVNDLNSGIYNFFWILKYHPNKLLHHINTTYYGKEIFLEARSLVAKAREKNIKKFSLADRVRFAWGIYLLYSMSIYRNGRNFSRDSLDTSKARQWVDQTKKLYECSARLRNATIEHEDALYTLERYDSKKTFCYIDPPYMAVKNPRSMNLAYHRNSMKVEDPEENIRLHTLLLEWALGAKSKVVISNYHNPLYDEMLSSWHVQEIKNMTITVAAKRGTSKVQQATEVIWANDAAYKAAKITPQMF